MHYFLSSLTFFLALVPGIAHADAKVADVSPPLAIGLVKTFGHATRVLITSGRAFTITEMSTGRVLQRALADAVVKATCGDEGIVLTKMPDVPSDESNDVLSDPILVEPEAAGVVQVALADKAVMDGLPPHWKHYRGSLVIRPNSDGTLQLINQVGVENYLYGVIPAEIGASAPAEALKAQAVAARTYALHNRGKLKTEGFDLDDTTRCENYLGVDGESAAANAAVDATCGEVMTYHGELIDAPYSTDCGGMTACDTRGYAPYLQAVRDAPPEGGPDYTASSKYHDWARTYTPREIEALLAKNAGTRDVRFAALTIDGYDASGRVTTATVTGTDASKRTVSGAQLRQILGPDRLRSTRVTLTVAPDGDYVFKGNGWGHGLGMCQLGAITMAKPPYNKTYRAILAHYYVGIDIALMETLKTSPMQAVPPAP